MKSLLALLFLCSVQLVVSRCPSGTVQGLSDQDCYFFSAAPAMWLMAEEVCLRRNGHLASVSSALSNAVLRTAASLTRQKELWLGGSYDTELPNQWSWTDERRFSYKNWARGQPANQDNYCTALDVNSGAWYSRTCNMAKPFVCKVPSSGASAISTTTAPRTTCRDGWTYVAAVGKCLTITESEDYWPNTRAKCKQLGGDLVSITNYTTNYALVDFASRKLSIGDRGFAWLAIGLHKPTANGLWQWTDGTPVTFTSWEAGFDDKYSIIAFMGVFGWRRADSGLKNGHWEGNGSSDAAYSKGICESKPL